MRLAQPTKIKEENGEGVRKCSYVVTFKSERIPIRKENLEVPSGLHTWQVNDTSLGESNPLDVTITEFVDRDSEAMVSAAILYTPSRSLRRDRVDRYMLARLERIATKGGTFLT